MRKLFFLFFLVIQTNLSSNEGWFEVDVKDPFSDEIIKAYDIKSFNSDIYDLPSKYDGIFWPFTDENFLVFNPKNGYINFYPEFETIKGDKKNKINNF